MSNITQKIYRTESEGENKVAVKSGAHGLRRRTVMQREREREKDNGYVKIRAPVASFRDTRRVVPDALDFPYLAVHFLMVFILMTLGPCSTSLPTCFLAIGRSTSVLLVATLP